MSISVGELFERFKDTPYVSEVHGADVRFSEFSPVERYTAGSVVFTDDPDRVEALRRTPPAAVVTTRDMAEALKDVEGLGIVVSDDVKLAHAFMRQAFDDIDYHDHEWPRLHPAAVIHESVQVPDSVTIGPGAVIGRGVVLGERVVVQANAVIETGAVIGEDSLVLAGVFIGRFCRIGRRVRLKPGCVVGAEGFGFARDGDKRYHRIPQKGIVVIEDDVLVSANVTIDRLRRNADRPRHQDRCPVPSGAQRVHRRGLRSGGPYRHFRLVAVRQARDRQRPDRRPGPQDRRG